MALLSDDKQKDRETKKESLAVTNKLAKRDSLWARELVESEFIMVEQSLAMTEQTTETDWKMQRGGRDEQQAD